MDLTKVEASLAPFWHQMGIWMLWVAAFAVAIMVIRIGFAIGWRAFLAVFFPTMAVRRSRRRYR